MLRRSLPVVLALLVSLSSCKKSPAAPETPATSTRIIAVSGDMDFGSVEVGGDFARTLNIRNNGNAVLQISGITVGANASNWTAGRTLSAIAVQPGTTEDVPITFRPTEAKSYNTTFTVNGNQTSGSATVSVTGSGVITAPPWFVSGVGNQVFDMPSRVFRVKITGDYSGFCQNFVVKVASRLIVNEILGTCSVASGPHYEGTHQLTSGGGLVETQLSTGINWTMTEVRQ